MAKTKKEKSLEVPVFAAFGYLSESVRPISKSDAISHAKGFLRRHATMLDRSYYFLAKTSGGWCWEVQEGGSGLAFLPSILEALEANPDRKIAIRTTGRTTLVYRPDTNREDGLESLILVEGDDGSGEPMAPSTRRMSFAEGDGTPLLVTGSVVFLAGFLSIAAIGSSWFLSPPTRYVVGTQTPPASVPILQWELFRSVPDGKYLSSARLGKGSWTMDYKDNPGTISGEADAVPATTPDKAGAVPEARR